METLFQILAFLQAPVQDEAVLAQMLAQGRQTPLPISRNANRIETNPYICLFDLLPLDSMTTHKRLFSDSRLVVAQRH